MRRAKVLRLGYADLPAGEIWAGDTGQEACDHYRRYQEDIRLMQNLGFDAYRFSIFLATRPPAERAR